MVCRVLADLRWPRNFQPSRRALAMSALRFMPASAAISAIGRAAVS